MTPEKSAVHAALRARQAPLRLWLRDDDAVRPTPALERLTTATTGAGVPLTLAVIPSPWGEAPTGTDLARMLLPLAGVTVAPHGWSHHSYAGPGEKKQELGAHRPEADVLAELGAGRARLAGFYGGQMLNMLVPPWNRIAPGVIAGLVAEGFDALSVFGPPRPSPAGLRMVNTDLDIIDWHGTRGGRPEADLWTEFAALIAGGQDSIGVLTHHLVHDAAAWRFLGDLFALTAGHSICRWVCASELMGDGH